MTPQVGSRIRARNEWENILRRWAQPLGAAEQDRSNNAERLVREAVRASEAAKLHAIEVFAKGSYANNTNIRGESDVDVAVNLRDVYFTNYQFAPTLTNELVGVQTLDYTFGEYKNDIGSALAKAFGPSAVTRGDKSFKVRENSYRVSADVV